MSEPEIEISADRARELADAGALIVDVREPDEWAAGHIDGARHIPLGELTAQAETLPKDTTIVFQCHVGARSLMAAQAFRQAGFDAVSLAGGLDAWQAAGLPLAPAS